MIREILVQDVPEVSRPPLSARHAPFQKHLGAAKIATLGADWSKGYEVMAITASNRMEWFANPNVCADLIRETRIGGAGGIYAQSRIQSAGDYQVPAFDEVSLQLVSETPADILRGAIDHGARFDVRSRSSELALAPAGTALRYTLDDPAHFLAVNIPRRYLIDTIDPDGAWNGDCGALHTTLFRDHAIEAMVHRLWAETAAGAPNGRLCGDSLSIALMVLVATRAGVRGSIAATPPPDWRLRRAMSLLQDCLGSNQGLAEVAAAVDLSPRQLHNLFRQHLGQTPHGWLTARRIEAARQRLAMTREPITDIAIACGFASSQHFAGVFQRHVGTTPSAFRRARAT